MRRRRELGLRRIDAACKLGVSWKTLMWWERDEREPFVSAYPAIITYLGYEPWPEPKTLADALKAERRRRGVEVRAAAALVGVVEGTWRRWERREWKPTRLTLAALDGLLGASTAALYPEDVR
jgi:transcriptional regulator with XRE-family HTH domain